MPDWTKPMQQTYEYYVVDPATWKDKTQLTNVKTSTVSRDLEAETLGSATIDITDSLGECYIRPYLVTIQNGIRERFCLGTFLVQTPSSNFDGQVRNITMDAYTPLLELKENPPPLGYSLLKDDNIMSKAFQIVREHARAPVVETACTETLHRDFISNTEDTWLTFTSDLIANAKYEFGLDELGRILFMPKQKLETLQPVWTYADDNASIMYPEISVNHDLYGVPNVVEVLYSNGADRFYARVVNDDPNSPVSTVNRGREITHRVTDPKLNGKPDNDMIQEYAKQLLESLSSVEYTVSYTHGYCPVRLGDCVRINSKKAGLKNVKAKVISQSIKCETGCPVSERAVFTNKLWR